MEISNKFRHALQNGFHYIPKHAKEAFVSAYKENPNIFHDLYEKQKALLISNYGIPEEALENHETIRQYCYEKSHTNHWFQFGFSSSMSSAMGCFPELLQTIYYHCVVDHSIDGSYGFDRVFSSKLACIFSLNIMICNFDESTGVGNEGMVSRIKDHKSKDKNGNFRSTRARFARSFNQQFPGFPEAFVDGLNDLWKDSYGTIDTSKFHIHVGRTRDHFLAAYENKNTARSTNIETTVFTKHLNHSCMQYDRGDEEGWEEDAIDSGIHCVEAYATTDSDFDGLESKRYFEVMYMTDKEDPFDRDAQVYGRTVFSRDPNNKNLPEFGPFYVTSNLSKGFMLRHVPNLIDEENREKFMEDFGVFLREIDSKNCYDYPRVWEGAIFRAYNILGEQFHKDKLTMEQSYPVIAPYLDIGRKSAFPVINEKNGYVYFSVRNNEMESYPNYDDEVERVVSGNIAFRASDFINHQGVNYIRKIKIKKKCDCCGKNTFSIKTTLAESLCHDCYDELYATCFFTGAICKKSEMLTMEEKPMFHAVRGGNVNYSVAVMEHIVGNKTSINTDLINFKPIIHNPRLHMCRMAEPTALISKDVRTVTIDEIHADGNIYKNENMVLNNNFIVEINGKNYFTNDDRICWDILNNEFVLAGQSAQKTLSFYFSNDLVKIKVLDNIMPVFDKEKLSITEYAGNEISVSLASFEYLIKYYLGSNNKSATPEQEELI